ncbi:sigma-54-dependent transcriptional regulator [Panacagrimonas sp.]|uniref:sigma-54-dependent transcriptional regulator n=1 Tax=Panacagrimonas sp. TaxID=2480088 RepID=UPI003B528016
MNKHSPETPPRTALIVDDEADIRELLEITLSRMGIRSCAAATLGEARAWLKERSFDFCITDMRLPDGNGIDLVRLVQQQYSRLPIAVLTAHGNAEAAVESLKAGAFDFVSKPVDLRVLRKLVETALNVSGAEPAVEAPAAAVRDDGGLLGAHESVLRLRQLVERLARSQAPVHIFGESGTGKELVARSIHAKSPRAGAPFVPVNCGAIPSELMESEFFGHLKGSFTGALRDKAGLFQVAEGGTLFLDEIADLPLAMQVKLLRAIQERAIRPVGAENEIPVNVRLISATHKNLSDLVASGAFRQDLYYRVNVIEVQTPPLRQRGADIALLAQHMLARLAPGAGLDPAPTLDDGATRLLFGYDFPGNVRELENILERALTLCDGRVIRAADLQLRQVAATPAAAADTPTAPATSAGGGFDDRVEEMERQVIREALEKTRYNKTKAAALLGLTFRQLRYKVKKLQLE